MFHWFSDHVKCLMNYVNCDEYILACDNCDETELSLTENLSTYVCRRFILEDLTCVLKEIIL